MNFRERPTFKFVTVDVLSTFSNELVVGFGGFRDSIRRHHITYLILNFLFVKSKIAWHISRNHTKKDQASITNFKLLLYVEIRKEKKFLVRNKKRYFSA